MADKKATYTGTGAWTVAAENFNVNSKDGATGKEITLSTAGKYLDRDIKIAAPTATVTDGAITTAAPTVTAGSASIAATSGVKTTTTANDYYIELTTTAGSAKSNAAVETAGWVDASETAQSAAADVDVSGNGTKIYLATTAADKTALGYGEKATIAAGYVPTPIEITNNTAAGTVEAAEVTVNATVASAAVDGKYAITGSEVVGVTSKTAGYIDATTGTMTAGSATISGSVNASTLSTTEVTPGAEQTVTVGAGYYPEARTVTVKAASTGATAQIGTVTSDPGDAYTENTAAIVPSGGYLKIDAGYMPATKISLATLVPDGTADKPAANANMLAGYKAYDKDGNLLTGTIAERTAANMTVSGKTVSIEAGYYDEAVSKDVATAVPTIAGTAMTGATGTADATASDVTVVVPVGYNETERTITASAGDAALSASATANAAITSLTETVDTANGVLKLSATQAISGTASAATTTTGRAVAGTTAATGSVTGNATVNYSIDLFDGSYTVA